MINPFKPCKYCGKSRNDMRVTNKEWQLLYDLYWLRFEKPGDQWYELTDYLREALRQDCFDIQYTEDDMIVDLPDARTVSMKEIVRQLESKLPKKEKKDA